MTQGIVVGIDASNLLEGGGVTHIFEILSIANPEDQGVARVVVWGDVSLLDKLPAKAWLDVRNPRLLRRGKLGRLLWMGFGLSREARAEGCDALFVPGGSYFSRFRPSVVMCRNMLPFEHSESARYGYSVRRLRLWLLRLIQTYSFRRTDGLIFLTDYARKSVLPRLGITAGDIVTIPHGVSRTFVPVRRDFRAIDNCERSSPFRLVYVSHASPYKHHSKVIEAVADLRRRTGWHIRLDMAGPRSVPATVREIEKRLKQYDPAGVWAFFHGPLSRDDLRNALHTADLGVFASSCENMPNVLLEKMAAGLPVASSFRGPMPEVLREFGFFFDPEVPSSIGLAIERAILDLSARRRNSREALKIAERYEWSTCAEDTFSFICRVTNRKRISGFPRTPYT